MVSEWLGCTSILASKLVKTLHKISVELLTSLNSVFWQLEPSRFVFEKDVSTRLEVQVFAVVDQGDEYAYPVTFGEVPHAYCGAAFLAVESLPNIA